MPAFNQLALYYLEPAKQKAGRDRRRQERATVIAQARRRPTAAARARGARVLAGHPQEPELRADPQHRRASSRSSSVRSTARSQEFETAAQARSDVLRSADELRRGQPLVPRLRAGRGGVPRGLEMRPNDYDAHLGLALALRGQIDDIELRQARRRGAGRARRSARSSRRTAPRPTTTRGSSRRSTRRSRAATDASPDARAGEGDLRRRSSTRRAAAPEYADAVKRSKERMRRTSTTPSSSSSEARRPQGSTRPDAKQKAAEAEAKRRRRRSGSGRRRPEATPRRPRRSRCGARRPDAVLQPRSLEIAFARRLGNFGRSRCQSSRVVRFECTAADPRATRA